jgi:hypothetical protein
MICTIGNNKARPINRTKVLDLPLVIDWSVSPFLYQTLACSNGDAPDSRIDGNRGPKTLTALEVDTSQVNNARE